METVKRPSRIWHQIEDETGPIDQVYRSDNKTRFIDQVNKPDQSIRSIDLVSNQVDKPQTENQVYKPGSITLENLRGNPLRVIRFLFTAIDNFQEKTTRKIQLAEIMQALEITRDSARTGLKFLNKTSLISTVDYFAGLNGWTRYKLQDGIFNEIWSIDQVHKSGSKPGLSSSSSYLNTTTTNINQVMPEIDISPLEDVKLPNAHVKFTVAHVQQIASMNTPEQIQEAIYQFAFDLEHTKKWRDHENPLRPFMSQLQKGIQWTAENYVSERERALQRQLDAKKRQKERLAKLEEEMLDLEFSDWLSNLPESEKEAIWPTGKKGMPQEVALKNHFRETLWPTIKAKI